MLLNLHMKPSNFEVLADRKKNICCIGKQGNL